MRGGWSSRSIFTRNTLQRQRYLLWPCCGSRMIKDSAAQQYCDRFTAGGEVVERSAAQGRRLEAEYGICNTLARKGTYTDIIPLISFIKIVACTYNSAYRFIFIFLKSKIPPNTLIHRLPFIRCAFLLISQYMFQHKDENIFGVLLNNYIFNFSYLFQATYCIVLIFYSYKHVLDIIERYNTMLTLLPPPSLHGDTKPCVRPSWNCDSWNGRLFCHLKEMNSLLTYWSARHEP